jgi:uncharacterized protein (TIGR01777 family)
MTREKIVLAGASGFLGRPLTGALQGPQRELVVLTRDVARASRHLAAAPEGAPAAVPGGSSASPAVRPVGWDARAVEDSWAAELDGAAAVVNLAGANLSEGRWTASRKAELLRSRLDATSAIVGAMRRLPAERRPGVLVNASGIDYYGDRGDEVMHEESSPGTSFLARLCVEWEAAARQAEALGVRVALMRTAVILAPGATVVQRLALPFKLFAGGPLGSGGQWFSWVHLRDAVGLYRLAIENTAAGGPINLCAPDSRPEREVARELGRLLHRPSWLPAPAFALRLALGEQADLVLHSRRAEPRKAMALGYTFAFPDLTAALSQALGLAPG